VNVWMMTGYFNLHSQASSQEVGKLIPCQVSPISCFFQSQQPTLGHFA